jgi:hypothetical protein
MRAASVVSCNRACCSRRCRVRACVPCRFKTILRFLRLCEFAYDDRVADPWVPIRGFVNALNKRLVKTVQLGTDVCIDESMSKWRGAGGKDGYHALRGLPHITKIIRCAACPRAFCGNGQRLCSRLQQARAPRLRVEDTAVC